MYTSLCNALHVHASHVCQSETMDKNFCLFLKPENDRSCVHCNRHKTIAKCAKTYCNIKILKNLHGEPLELLVGLN